MPFSLPRHLLLAALLVGTALPVRGQWHQLTIPDPPVATAVLVTDDVMLLGTHESDTGELFRSTDGGHTWENVHRPNNGVDLFYAHGSTFYAGTYLSGLLRSHDRGLTWEVVGNGAPQGSDIKAMDGRGDTLFVATASFHPRGVFRSTDGGQSWHQLTSGLPPSSSAIALAVAEAHVFVAVGGQGLYRSADWGASWEPAVSGLPASANVAVLVAGGGHVYAGVTSIPAGLYRSDDQGQSWSLVSTGIPSAAFTALRPHGPSLYAAFSAFTGTAGVYRSDDAGATWTRLSSGLPGNGSARALALHPQRRNLMLAGTPAGLFRSEDNGAQWTHSDDGASAVRGVRNVLLVDDALLIGLSGVVSSNGRGLWRSTDGGQTWMRPAGYPEGGLASGMARHGGLTLATAYSFPRAVFRSPDGGLSWNQGSGFGPSSILYAVHGHGEVLLAGAHDTLYRSTDGGAAWASHPGLPSISSFASHGGAVYLGTHQNGVRRSTDGGLTWADVSAGLTQAQARWIRDLEVHEGALFAATAHGVYRLDGATWTQTAFGGGAAALLSVEPVLLAAGSGLSGVIRYSTDAGASWTDFSEGLAAVSLTRLAAGAGQLYAGTTHQKLWARPLSDLPLRPAREARVSPLLQALFPNPVRDGADVSFALAEAAEVSVTIYDVLGRAVAVLAEGPHAAGLHRVYFDATRLSAGVYLARVAAGDAAVTRPVTVVR